MTYTLQCNERICASKSHSDSSDHCFHPNCDSPSLDPHRQDHHLELIQHRIPPDQHQRLIFAGKRPVPCPITKSHLFARRHADCRQYHPRGWVFLYNQQCHIIRAKIQDKKKSVHGFLNLPRYLSLCALCSIRPDQQSHIFAGKLTPPTPPIMSRWRFKTRKYLPQPTAPYLF